jgi:hypothetical protein
MTRSVKEYWRWFDTCALTILTPVGNLGVVVTHTGKYCMHVSICAGGFIVRGIIEVPFLQT